MKPGRDREPAGVDTFFALRRLEIADARDAIAANRHIGLLSLAARAVVNRAVFDDDIEICGCERR